MPSELEQTAAGPAAQRRAAASGIEGITRENIAAVERLQEAVDRRSSPTDRFALRVRDFCASPAFLWLHVLWFSAWIVLNAWPGAPHFDPYPFTFLTLVVSLEAIFLSTFILISQAHSGKLDEQRNQLDLQINLLTEQENTKMLLLLDRIAAAVGVNAKDDPGLRALEQPTEPCELAQQISEAVEKKEGRDLRS